MTLSTEPARKRSRVVRLTTMATVTAATLSACDVPSTVNPAQLSEQHYGAGVPALSYNSVGECIAAGRISADACAEAQKTAIAQNERGAPRFDSQEVCEEQHGAGACMQQSSGNGPGGSFFTPLLTGFVIGQLLNGNRAYSGLYRGRDGTNYTGGGTGGGFLYRDPRTGGSMVGRDAVTTPVSTPRVQTRSSVVSRGGFGGRATQTASSGGGWGGGRGYGG